MHPVYDASNLLEICELKIFWKHVSEIISIYVCLILNNNWIKAFNTIAE